MRDNERDYIAFTHKGLQKPSGNAKKDGESLAKKCIKNLPTDNLDQFPPKLLILLASPDFIINKKNARYADELLEGIHETFRHFKMKPSLIGSSVAGVFFNKKIHPKGALLICLSSRLIDVKVAYGRNARKNPTGAIQNLLTKLELVGKATSDIDKTAEISVPEHLIDPNPLANKVIFTFMPGCKEDVDSSKFYPASEIHKLLYEGVSSRIMMAGGVSSANDITRRKDGYQFCGKKLIQDAVVAAIIKIGVPIGIGLNDALVSTKNILRIAEVGEGGRTVVRFGGSGDSASEKLEQIGKEKWKTRSLMFAKMSSDDDRTLDLPLPANDEGAVGLLREIEIDSYVEVLEPKQDILESFRDGIKQSRERVFVENLIANLLFICKSYSRFHTGELLNIETALSQIDTHNCPCIGGFFDGEIGVDKRGRSRLTNGSVSYVTFGDEMRERTPLYKGVSALAEFGPRLLGHREITHNSVEDAIQAALKIIDEAGFLGAMISLVLPNMNRKNQQIEVQNEEQNNYRDFVIARGAIGKRFEKILEQTKRPCEGNDILAIVVNDKENIPRFIPDSSDPATNCDKKAIKESGLISQYVLPLKRLNGKVFGTLQVDMGNLKNLTEEEFKKSQKARVLNSFAEIIGAGLNRIANAIENDFMLLIDKALQKSMKETEIISGIRKFIEILKEPFGVDVVHVWLIDFDNEYENINEQPLYLQTGLSEFFNSQEKLGLKRKANKETPVHLAFKQKGPHIINDLWNDAIWKKAIKKADYKELSAIQSYAAIRFEDEKGKGLGVISLGSVKPWFFLNFHRDIMDVLAYSLSFLIEHLRTKIHNNFLREVTPNLKELNLNDERQNILNNITDTFSKALDAEFASLYLLDEDKNKYVLRSGYKWKDENWIHAASYENNIDWFGLKEKNDFPVYEPDLFEYYKLKKYKFPGGRYSKHIFGQQLSEKFTVEAIALPLQIGNDKFGVMTFYRQIKKEQPSGFRTKNIELLQEAANQATGFVNALLEHRRDIWKKDENDRRQKVIQALNPDQENYIFEVEVCRKLLEIYKASEVAFYQVYSSKEQKKCLWQTGYYIDIYGEAIESLIDNSNNYSETIKESLSICFEDVRFNQYKLNEKDYSDPQSLKIESLKDEVYIPVSSGNEFLAILIVRWKLNPDDSFFPEVSFNHHLLRALGRTIGSRYRKELLAMASKKKSLAIDCIITMGAQGAHDLRKNIGIINYWAEKLKNGKGDINTLLESVEIAMNNANQIIDIGRDIISLNIEKKLLSKLILETFEKDGKFLYKKLKELKIQTPSIRNNDYFVYVDSHYTKDALFNLFDNARESIERKIKSNKMTADPKISIKIIRENYREIKLIISDNGEGMTEEERFKSQRGFWRKKDGSGGIHTCFGVLIADRLLTIQGGSLKYKSEKGVGTDTEVILPLVKMV